MSKIDSAHIFLTAEWRAAFGIIKEIYCLCLFDSYSKQSVCGRRRMQPLNWDMAVNCSYKDELVNCFCQSVS